MKSTKGFLAVLVLVFGLGVIDASAQQTMTKQTTTTTTRQTSSTTSSRQTSSTGNNGRRRRIVRRHKKVVKHVSYGRRRGATRTTTVRSGSTKVTVTKTTH